MSSNQYYSNIWCTCRTDVIPYDENIAFSWTTVERVECFQLQYIMVPVNSRWFFLTNNKWRTFLHFFTFGHFNFMASKETYKLLKYENFLQNLKTFEKSSKNIQTGNIAKELNKFFRSWKPRSKSRTIAKNWIFWTSMVVLYLRNSLYWQSIFEIFY